MKLGCHNCQSAIEKTQEGDNLFLVCSLSGKKIKVGIVIADINKVVYNDEICKYYKK
jgi:protein-disulfide isomerase